MHVLFLLLKVPGEEAIFLHAIGVLQKDQSKNTGATCSIKPAHSPPSIVDASHVDDMGGEISQDWGLQPPEKMPTTPKTGLDKLYPSTMNFTKICTLDCHLTAVRVIHKARNHHL